MITGIAVTLDSKTARKFWENKLRDGDAAKVYQKALATEDLDYSNEWGLFREKHHKNLHKFMHITKTAIQNSFIIADDRKSISPTLGGYFAETKCIGIGILYAGLSFQAAANSSYALRNAISDDKELDRNLKDLETFYKLLQDKWGKDIVKLREELGLS